MKNGTHFTVYTNPFDPDFISKVAFDPDEDEQEGGIFYASSRLWRVVGSCMGATKAFPFPSADIVKESASPPFCSFTMSLEDFCNMLKDQN